MFNKLQKNLLVEQHLSFVILAVFAWIFAIEPSVARDADPVDKARAMTKNRILPKAKPGAIGTPPIITRKGASVPGTPAPFKARNNSNR